MATQASKSGVNIVISATDQASKQLNVLLGSLEAVADFATGAFQSSFETSASSIINSLAAIGNSVNEVGRFIENLDRIMQVSLGVGLREFVIQNVEDLNKELEEAFESTLTEVGTAIGQVVTLDALIPPDFGQRLATLTGAIPSSIKTSLSALANSIDSTFILLQQKLESTSQQLVAGASAAGDFVGGFSGLPEFTEVFGSLKEVASSAFSAISGVTEQIYFFSSGLDALQSIVATGLYQSLIQQNVDLRKSLIETQSTLAATNKVLKNGVLITDPTEAIKSLDAPVNAAIDRIRKQSLELVGVTSKDLVGVFNVVASEASKINISLDQGADLTSSLAAAMGTLGIPLYQAGQEVSSILTATTDSNSVLAKSLGLRNEELSKITQQGKLYDFLTKKLESFRAGNALSAQTLDGVLSNIQEVIDTIGLKAGAGLLEPLVGEINKVYEFLNKNFETIQGFASTISDYILNIGLSISKSAGLIFGSFGKALGPTVLYIFDFLSNTAEAFAKALESTLPLIQPVINTLTALISGALAFANSLAQLPMAQYALQFKILSSGVGFLHQSFKTFLDVTPIVGEALFLMGLRSDGVVGSFTNLSKIFQGFGLGKTSGVASGFLLLAKNMNSIPFVAGAMQQKITGLLGPFGALGGAVTAMVPSLAAGGIAFASLASKFPIIQTTISSLATRIPGVLTSLSGQATRAGLTDLSTLLATSSTQFATFASSGNVAATATEKFKELVGSTQETLLKTVTSLGVWAAGLGAAFLVFDELVLKNEGVKKALLGVFETIKQGIGILQNFLTQPVILATTAVVGLTLAIQSGLVASLFASATAVVGLVSANIVGWVVSAQASLVTLSASLTGTSLGFSTASGGALGFAGTLSVVTRGTLLQFGAVMTRLTGDLLIRFGSVLAGMNFTGLATQLAGLGNRLYALGASTLTSGAALQGLGNTSKLMSINFASIGQAVGATTTAMKSFLITAAPIALLVGIIVSVTEAAQVYTSVINANKKETESFLEIVEEAEKKLAAARAKRGQVTPGKDLEGDRLKEIQEKQNLVTKGFDAVRKAIGTTTAAESVLNAEVVGFGSAISAAGKKLDELKASSISTELQNLETEKNKLRNQQAVAKAKNDDYEVKSIDKKIQGIDDEIAARKRVVDAALEGAQKMKPTTEGALVAQAQLIKSIEAFKEKLSETSNVKLLPQDLPILGDTITQLKQKADGAWNSVLNPTGQDDIFKQKAQEVVDLTQKLYEMGQVSPEEALEKFAALANNASLDQEVQLKAQEAITKIIESEAQSRIAIIQRQQTEVQAALKSGAIGEAQAAKEASALKLQELEEQKQAALDKQASAESFGNVEAAKNAAEEVKKIEADLSAAIGEELQRRNKERLKDFDEQMSLAKRQKSEGLLDDTQFAEKSAEIETAKNKEEIRQLEEQLGKISSTDKEGREALNAQINEAYAKQKEIRDKAFQEEIADIKEDTEERIKIEQSKVTKYDDNGAVTNKEEVVQKTAEISQKGIDDEIARINEEIAKTSSTDKEGKEKLLAQLADAEAKKKELQQKAYQDRLSAIREQGEKELKIAEGNITDSRELARAKTDIQIKALDKEIKIATGPELGEALKKRREVIQQGLQDELSAIREDSDEKAKLLDADLAKGNKTEEQFNKESLANQQSSLNTQLQALQSALSKIKANDKEGREKINAQIAEIEKKKVDIIAEAQKRELDLLKRQQDKALDLVTESENARLIEIQKLKNSGDVSDAEAEEEKIKLTQNRLKKQLELEKDFLGKMESQAPLSDPAKEAERQDQIREQRKKTQDITIQLLENEAKAWESYVNRVVSQINRQNNKELMELQKQFNEGSIDQEDIALEKAKDGIQVLEKRIALEKDQSKIIELQLQLEEAKTGLLDAQAAKLKGEVERANLAVENSIKRQNLELTRQQTLIDSATKALDMRSQLLQSQKNLQDASANYLTTELDALAKTERSEFKKKQIAELTAAIKLDSAIKQAEFDKQSLAIEQQKQNFALQRERIANRIAIAEAQLGVKKAEGALRVAAADPRTSEEEKERLRLEVETARDMLGLRNQEKIAIGEQAALQEQLQARERQAQELKNKGNIRSAQSEAIANITNPGQRRAAENDLRSQIASDFGARDVNDLLGRGRASAEQIRRDAGIGAGTPRYSDPEDKLRDTVGDSEYQKSRGGVAEEFNRRYGDGAMPLFPQQSYTPLNLPEITAPKVNLPASGATNNNQAVTVSPIINLNITADSKSAGEAIQKAVQPNLENVINEAQRQSAKLVRG